MSSDSEKRKLNCHVEMGSARLPCPSQSVMPSWMMRSRSTLHLSLKNVSACCRTNAEASQYHGTHRRVW